jgi:hypothetical protein
MSMPLADRTQRPAPRWLATGLLVVLLAGCVGGGGTASTPPGGQPIASGPPVASSPGAGGSDGSTGAGSAGNPGSGSPGTGGVTVGPTPGGPGVNQPKLLVPKPGQLQPHPVVPLSLQASVDGRHVLVKITWYGGIEPCSVLDSVKVDRSGTTIALTVIEGSSDLTAVCPEIAMLKATLVDLGELGPGVWTITAPNSDVVPIQLTIS